MPFVRLRLSLVERFLPRRPTMVVGESNYGCQLVQSWLVTFLSLFSSRARPGPCPCPPGGWNRPPEGQVASCASGPHMREKVSAHRDRPVAGLAEPGDTVETKRAAHRFYGNQDAIAQRSSPGLALTRANRDTARHRGTCRRKRRIRPHPPANSESWSTS